MFGQFFGLPRLINSGSLRTRKNAPNDFGMNVPRFRFCFEQLTAKAENF